MSGNPHDGLLVQMEGNPCSCGEDTTVIGPGTETHAGRLDCAGCGKFRLWLPREIHSFVTECINKIGVPTDPIVYRDRSISIGDKAMTAPREGFQTKPNTGALFRDQHKTNDEDRDYSGVLNLDGAEYWLSGWIKQSKKTGKKYLSIMVKPKDEPVKRAAKPDLNDEVPW